MIKSKHKGGITAFVLFAMLSLLVVSTVCFVFLRYAITLSAESVQDDLVFSNMAVYKYVDKKALGEDISYIRIEDPLAAIEEFKRYLIKNMSLDSNLNTTKNSFVSGQVAIEKFIIYNVKDDNVEILIYNKESDSFQTKNENLKINHIKTPNGFVVDRTMVHSTISFEKELVFGEVKRESVSVDTDLTKKIE